MKYNPIIQRLVAVVLLIGILSSCNRYHLSSFAPSELGDVKSTLSEDLGEYVVVHLGDESWQIVDYSIEDGELSGTLTAVDQVQEDFYSRAVEDNIEDVYEEEGEFKEQTHIYVDEFAQLNGDQVVIDLKSVKDANAIKQNGPSRAWRIIRGVLLVIGGLFLGMAVLLLIACNCPHAYTFDGDSYHYTNTLFTGATASNLERNDYKILQDYRPDKDTYEMFIKNEDNESQYTNLLELMVVGHSNEVEVVTDQSGNVYSIAQLQKALKIVNDRGEDISTLTSHQDEVGYTFDAETNEELLSTYATFEKPKDVSNAKLVLNLKNTKWGGVVYKTFANMMGDKYSSWVDGNRDRSTNQARKDMKEAGIPLVVSVKQNGEWMEVENINLIGEVAYNSLAVPVSEELITGENIEVRLQAGFKFWDLDFVGMDFSEGTDYELQVLHPSQVTGDVNDLVALQSNDDLYMEHTSMGDSTYLKFENLNTDTENRTIILRSKGYYTSNDVYAGNPYWKGLLKVKKGGLSWLSKELYGEMYKQYALQAEH